MPEKLRLLIVEDDGLIRLDLVDMVADFGYLTDEAATADKAVKQLEADNSISAVLTDIDMPGSINGLGLANVIHDRWPDIKVVVISGRYSPAAGVLPPGAVFLSKPVSPNSLKKALSETGV